MNRKIFEKLAQLRKSIPQNASHLKMNAGKKTEQLKKDISQKAGKIKNEASQSASTLIERGSQDIKKTLQKSKLSFEMQKEKLKELKSKVGEKSQSVFNDIDKLKGKEVLKDMKKSLFNGTEQGNHQKYIEQKKKEIGIPATSNQQKKQFNGLFFSFTLQRALARTKEFYSKNLISQMPSSLFGKIMSNLYWKFLFMLSVLLLIYKSPQLIKAIVQINISLKSHEDKQALKKTQSQKEKHNKQSNL